MAKNSFLKFLGEATTPAPRPGSGSLLLVTGDPTSLRRVTGELLIWQPPGTTTGELNSMLLQTTTEDGEEGEEGEGGCCCGGPPVSERGAEQLDSSTWTGDMLSLIHI